MGGSYLTLKLIKIKVIMGESDNGEFEYAVGARYPESGNMDELFDNGNLADQRTEFGKHYMKFVGAATFGLGPILTNIMCERPIFAGFYKTVLLAGFGAYFYTQLDHWAYWKARERDAVLKHYVSLHREDFPVPQRKTFGEVLRPWTPTH